MVTSAFDIGDLKTLSVTFTNIAGANTDPTSVTLTIKEPDGTITTKIVESGGVIKDSTGKYHFDFAITKAGRHIVNWLGAGTVAEATETEFYARRKEAVA